MKARCDNPNTPQWNDYGGRGISYTDEWETFEGFLKDMGEPASGLSLDRIDNDLGYSKHNCRWADVITQRINQRPYNAQATGRTACIRINQAQPIEVQRYAYRKPPRDSRFDLPAGGQSLKHGQRSGVLQHGKRPQGYAAWVNMRQRCTNPKTPDFKNYGGRGITHCRRWEAFEAFLSDMGEPEPNMTLDRIDNMGDYTPENCRWITRAVQNLNKRNCVRYELNGKSQTLAEWARETGIGRVTMLKRIQAGVPLRLALTVRGFLPYARRLVKT